jgi:hypothetical protein
VLPPKTPGLIRLAATLFAVTCMTVVARAQTFTAIDVPDARGTIPMGINAEGDIVGTFFNSTGP